MKKCLFIIALLCLPAAGRAAILIDNFSASQNLAIAPGTSSTEGGVSAAGAIGGARFASLATFGFANPTGASTVTINDSNNGMLVLTPDDDDDIQVQLIYDGNAGAHAGPNGNGLGGINLMAAGALTIQIDARSTHEVDASLFLYTGSVANYYRYNFKFPALGLDAEFSTISIDLVLDDHFQGGSGFQPISLGAIDLIIDTQTTFGLVQIDEMRFVPEPSSLVLVATALGALVLLGLSRRRAN